MLCSVAACGGESGQASTTAPLTPTEWVSSVRGCLEQAGVEVIPLPEGGGAFEYRPRAGMSDSEMDTIVSRCQEPLGAIPNPVDAETADRYLDRGVVVADCLDQLGYEISQAPSREFFRAEFAKGNGPPWDPWAEVSSQFASVDDQQVALSRCPPWPE